MILLMHLSNRLCGESGSIMVEGPALSAWRVGAMLIPSAGVYPCLHSPAV